LFDLLAVATSMPADVPLWSMAALISLLTLTALEIVLGIDNVVFIAILVDKLPAHQRDFARRLGLGLAMGMRIVLLLGISWVMSLTKVLFTLPLAWAGTADIGISGKDLVLIIGGLFLIWKSTKEIHHKLEGVEDQASGKSVVYASLGAVLFQITLLDIVFSLDSVITAVGMAQHLPIMIAAVVIAVLVMLVFSGHIAEFVKRHPSLKVLALSFLLLIGFTLVVDGLHAHIPKGYIYFAMAFSLGVEVLNIRLRKRGTPVELHEPKMPASAGQ
jgi:predicted tellurium resistance membrane protein TerC